MMFERGGRNKLKSFPNNFRAQVTIFIIFAILIVAIVALVFVFKDKIPFGKGIPSEFEPVYNTLRECLKEDLDVGISSLESQGGYIYTPEYEEGSEYMPFSSQLDFLGNPIPYWYYVSGNNLHKEQVPSLEDMQKDLETYMETRSRNCFFGNYYAQGYSIKMEEPEADVTIKDDEIVFDLTMDFTVSRGEEKYVVREHKVVIKSELGSLYNSAIKVYNKEQQDLFLEKYGIDILTLYAPVDGVEITCAPKVWNANVVFDDLREAIQANTVALKGTDNKKEYFDVEIEDLPSDQRVRFLNSPDWTNTLEVNPSDGPMMIANPVGNQPGFGILGFCYVPYHFVYSIKYPVLVQVISGDAADEIFQFPMAVVIERNTPRNVSGGEAFTIDYEELCKYKNTRLTIQAFNTDLQPLDGYVTYSCGTTCNIGELENGKMTEKFPQCVNGFVNVRADGYKEESVMYSTVDEGLLNIYLDKLYNLSVLLKIDKKNYDKEAVISFISDDFSATVFYPQQKTVQLAEGLYEVQVYVYKNSTLKVGATTQQQCFDVPRSSVFGLFGFTKEKCFEIEIPAQMISQALSAGGKANYTFSETELKNSRVIDIYAESLPNPDSLDQIQMNYILFEDKKLEIDLR